MATSTQQDPHPGPMIDDLLFLHAKHRARGIYTGAIEDRQLTIRRCDASLWDHVPIPNEVNNYVRQAGFANVIGGGRIFIDHALITALVERWRPETHTFHLPIGEATVTLQDVEVLWGLHIDGSPVIGNDEMTQVTTWIEMCESLLGFTPAPTDIDGCRIKISCFYKELDRPFSNQWPEERFQQRARVYIMLILGGQLLADKSGNKMPLFYLPMIADFDKCKSYSWGSAVLGHLYRNLCDATSPNASDIAGPMVLLQVRQTHINNLAYFTHQNHFSTFFI